VTPGPLRLSIDVSAVPAQPVGAGRYTADLTRALAARPDVTLTAWCRRNDAARWAGIGPVMAAGTRPMAPVSRPARIAWEQARLPRLVDRADVAVHHGPHYTMPERAATPCVVTVHDLTFFDHPEWHERSKVLFFRRAIRQAARRADAVVCVSGVTAQRFEERCAPTGRVFVVPHGVDHAVFRPAAGGAGTSDDDDIIRGLGVRPPYVLFLGTLEPRKAVPDLVAAFDRVAAGRPDLSLVLAGRPGWGVRSVDQAVAAAKAGDRVHRTGYVPDGAVPALLRAAAAVAYPARQEGFGLPALEALACGAPLVTTQATAMAEMAQGAALLVRAGSVSDLADALASAVDGGSDQRHRTRAGLEIAATHTWETSAAHHVAAYRWVAAGRRAG
jgi:glycosyltransferase involved in cell wall biosynthesis